MQHSNPIESLPRLNAIRILVVLSIALGYASTMPLGPGNPEVLTHMGYSPSWIGIHLLFFFSGFLALRSIRKHGSALKYLHSRVLRNVPLLAVFTLISILIIYPALGVMNEDPLDLLFKLGGYFFLTVSCVDPGRVLPGLLDEANYMCLIQGAIWTFKWGAIAHIAAAIGTRLGFFNKDKVVLAIALLALSAHFILSYIQAAAGYSILEAPALGLRLAYPFLIGMACYAYRDKLPSGIKTRAAILAGLIGGAGFMFAFLPWTPAIEIMTIAFWGYAGLLLATSTTSAFKFLEGWPNLALAIYLVNWPASQLLLLVYPGISSWGLIALSLPVSTLVALAAHKLISRPSYSFARLQTLKPAF